MEKRVSRRQILRSEAIGQLNDATLVLRHFVELSARLLPLFNELSVKERLLPVESEDRKKILAVYHAYQFDTSTSLVLMNSPILEIIKKTYDAIEHRLPGDDSEADLLLDRFLSEKEKLTKQWNSTELN